MRDATNEKRHLRNAYCNWSHSTSKRSMFSFKFYTAEALAVSIDFPCVAGSLRKRWRPAAALSIFSPVPPATLHNIGTYSQIRDRIQTSSRNNCSQGNRLQSRAICTHAPLQRMPKLRQLPFVQAIQECHNQTTFRSTLSQHPKTPLASGISILSSHK